VAGVGETRPGATVLAMTMADGPAPLSQQGDFPASTEVPLPRILFAHADADLLDQVARLLEPRYDAATATGSAQALAAARERRPDLILCDARLEGEDGLGLSQALRSDPALRDVPLVLVMDRAENEPMEGAIAAEADDLLYRPFAPAELIARIEHNLKLARQRREAANREAALREEAAGVIRRIEIVLTHLPFGLTMVSPDGKIIYANPARERLLRFQGQPKVGDQLAERLPARYRDGTPLAPEEYPIRRALKGELAMDVEIQYDSGDGPPHWLRASGIPVPGPDGKVQYAIGVAVDISGEMQAQLELLKLTESLEERVRTEIDDRLKAEEALRQVQKMQAIGQLTGGVAHDFNNLLQVMLGNLDAIARHLRSNAPLDRSRTLRQAESALSGAERATQMTQQMLAFSRRQPLNPTSIDANKLVLGLTELLRRTLGENVAIDTAIASDLKHAFADPNQLESALLNLAVNARDAMPAGGRMTIETANCSFDETTSHPWEEFTAGEYVMVAVSDTGTGIPADIMPRIFEPFFTTKEAGRGTGLGLSQAYGFAKQSGGHIKIYSEVDVGTTVKLFLPARPVAAAAEKRDASPPARRGTRSEVVLVVEDDPNVREFSVETLRELGYGVIAAGSGAEALQQLENEPRIQLVFTDVGLPGGMTGRQLADEARSRWPNLKVLFTTGYARDAIVHHGRLDPGVELITKPFTASALAARIRDLLEST
jgi:signal transduction histidine kinase